MLSAPSCPSPSLLISEVLLTGRQLASFCLPTLPSPSVHPWGYWVSCYMAASSPCSSRLLGKWEQL